MCGEADLDEGALTFDIWNSRTDHGGLYKRSYIYPHISLYMVQPPHATILIICLPCN